VSRTDTIYYGSNAPQRLAVTLQEEDARTLTVDLSAYCGMEDVEIDSASWNVLDNATNVGLSGITTGTKTTAGLVTASESGEANIQCSVVLDNGELVIFVFRVICNDPEPIRLNDYRC
jgi:hypothetical protein